MKSRVSSVSILRKTAPTANISWSLWNGATVPPWATACRRILLSSLPGTAATSIKIAGVQHEFSTIPGVKEDVTEIVLNVKKIIARLHSQGAKTVYIDATGECEVTAGDIKADGEVEILNPDLHICTLGPDATFNMEITMNHGRGYVSSDKNKTPNLPIGTIAVDSIYTPVYKVNYTVENTRVGNMTDYDKLTLGSLDRFYHLRKRCRVSLGAKILSDHLSPVHRPLRDGRQQADDGRKGGNAPRQSARADHRRA